jgi:hypothetical protein
MKKQGIIRSYSTGPYNKANDKEQWIRISQGCPNQCPFCYEPKVEVVYPIPEIIRNDVKIMDMNLLSKPGSAEIIKQLGENRVNGKTVRYQLVCGIDWRYLTKELAGLLKRARFDKIRLAWDFEYSQLYKINDALAILLNVGYAAKSLTVFMVCNWQISYEMCFKKLYMCAVWNVKVADCYFDGQVSPNIKPLGWTADEIVKFRRLVRKHNQLVTFGIDPEVKIDRSQYKLFES